MPQSAHQRDVGLESVLSKIKHAELPTLRWGTVAQKPQDLENWVESVGLDLGGLHWHIKRYWVKTVESVMFAHSKYLLEGYLMRHAVRPQPLVPEEFEVLQFHAIELRLSSLLLHLVPKAVKTMCLSTKLLTTADILFTCFVDAGPGTGIDKETVLERVRKGRAVEIKGVFNELAEWKFGIIRLGILNANLADPSSQMGALKSFASWLLAANEEFKHRFFAFLVQNNLQPATITQPQVDILWQYLSGEAREHAGEGKEAAAPSA